MSIHELKTKFGMPQLTMSYDPDDRATQLFRVTPADAAVRVPPRASDDEIRQALVDAGFGPKEGLYVSNVFKATRWSSFSLISPSFAAMYSKAAAVRW
jgi:hypothetical protein